VVQSLVHNVDRAGWALREQSPVKAHGLGGRATCVGEIYGDVFDHHSIVYEYATGVRMYAFARTAAGCYDDCSSVLLGTKGRANLTRHHVLGETKWRYQGAPASGYELEQQKLFGAIRSKTPINNGDYMLRSARVTILGQLACYTGKEMLWEDLEKSTFAYQPIEADFSSQPPVKTDANGVYPCRVPGQFGIA
jgi:myo-inositol 2-dehydrogenase / D-chiro-inositol 1-dehydrogenase